MMAAGSEKISKRWIEGADRTCVRCGIEIKNLEKQVGVVRTMYPGRRREIVCMNCWLGPARKKLGLCPQCGRELHGYRGPLCRYCDPEVDCE